MSQPTQPSLSPTEPLSIVVERAESDQTERKPIKGEKQYRDFLLQSLGVTSLMIALLICWVTSLPTFLAEELSLTSEEVEMFATPGARLLAKSKIPDNVKNGLINSGDYIGLGTACVVYIYRVLDTMRKFNGSTINEHSGQGQRIPTASPANGANATYNGSFGATSSQLAGWGNFRGD